MNPSSNPPTGQARSRARAASTSSPPTPRAHSPTPAPAEPTLDELLTLPDDALAHLSVGALKAVLFRNHVNARLVVEKAELVAKVRALVEDERAERARRAVLEAAEEEERRERAGEGVDWDAGGGDGASVMDVDGGRGEMADGQGQGQGYEEAPLDDAARGPTPRAPQLERTGLCVICQDEEANTVIVDCG